MAKRKPPKSGDAPGQAETKSSEPAPSCTSPSSRTTYKRLARIRNLGVAFGPRHFFARTDSVTVGDTSIIPHRFTPFSKGTEVMRRLIFLGILALATPAMAQSTGTLQ